MLVSGHLCNIDNFVILHAVGSMSLCKLKNLEALVSKPLCCINNFAMLHVESIILYKMKNFAEFLSNIGNFKCN